MTQLPPIYRDQRKVDAEHLRLLAIFHFVLAGLAVAGMGFLLMHYAIFTTIFANPDFWEGHNNPGPPPDAFFAMFKWYYLIMGLVLIAACTVNLLSGLFIRRRKHRTFSLVVAGIDCIQIPFGTVLGVFTILVLVRESVRETYDTEQ